MYLYFFLRQQTMRRISKAIRARATTVKNALAVEKMPKCANFNVSQKICNICIQNKEGWGVKGRLKLERDHLAAHQQWLERWSSSRHQCRPLSNLPPPSCCCCCSPASIIHNFPVFFPTTFSPIVWQQEWQGTSLNQIFCSCWGWFETIWRESRLLTELPLDSEKAASPPAPAQEAQCHLWWWKCKS